MYIEYDTSPNKKDITSEELYQNKRKQKIKYFETM